MNRVQVISVDPGIKTRGELLGKEECLARIGRCLAVPTIKAVSVFKKSVNLFFGINAETDKRFSTKAFLFRFIFGSLIIMSVLLPMAPAEIMSFSFDVPSAISLTVGFMLIIGLFTRLTSLCGAGWFGYLFTVSAISLNIDVALGALFMASIALALFGPGIYSIDQLIRVKIFALRKGILRKRKMKKEQQKQSAVLSYQAFTKI